MTSGTLLKVSLLVFLLLPGLVVAAATLAWWSGLSKPWLFVLLGLLSTYSLSAYLMLRQFGQVGVAGEASVSAAAAFKALLVREGVSSLVMFAVVTAAILLLLRWVFSTSKG